MDSENKLGDYLRARRALVRVQDVGLPDVGPRQVPGLRRDEVALLAGVSTDYYMRLEQGRERHPSDQVLRSIARALRLDDAEPAHLFRLGLPVFGAGAAAPLTVAPELVRLMDGMPDVPAFLLGAAQDILGANAMARELYREFARSSAASTTPPPARSVRRTPSPRCRSSSPRCCSAPPCCRCEPNASRSWRWTAHPDVECRCPVLDSDIGERVGPISAPISGRRP
ncbi:helix-turn-helix domain-containing protein [Kribbella sp. NPDC000426]|uniref:helix-turn-helix domain-containing protein n=1 Tax=Kribbella sp. NPDC000426 TaxID=3154255 RepID=UPI003323712A